MLEEILHWISFIWLDHCDFVVDPKITSGFPITRLQMFLECSDVVKMCRLYDFFGGENGRMKLDELIEHQTQARNELLATFDDLGCIISQGDTFKLYEPYWFSSVAFFQNSLTRRHAFGQKLVIGKPEGVEIPKTLEFSIFDYAVMDIVCSNPIYESSRMSRSFLPHFLLSQELELFSNNQLAIRGSKLHGHGVFAKKTLKKGICFTM